MGKAIGIDLGTTNSVAAVSDGQTQRVLLNTQHEELTPSVVSCESFEEEGEKEFFVGRTAVAQAKLNPKDTIYSIKRLMGRPLSNEHIQQWKDKVPFEIEESSEPVAGLATVVMGGESYLPEDISAMVLKEIKRYSETALGTDVTHAVVTVPAYFGEPERAATREAGKKAGLVVKTLLPEPTAAAIAFGTEARSEEGSFVLVFDLGGGTFDISILSIVGDDYNVMEVHGDHFLGGDDFDELLVEMILQHVREKDDIDLAGDRRFHILARAEAEAAKKSLSSLSTDATRINIPEAARVGDKVVNVRMKITRQKLERAISGHVEHCTKLVQEALENQSLTPELISDVLLVGGSTAVPLVYRSMEKLFGKKKVRRDVNPMHCVALGAGILAHRMRGIECPNAECRQICDESETHCSSCGESLAAARPEYDGIHVTEITTNQFGVQVVSGTDAYQFKPLVDKGLVLPLEEPGEETLYTADEGQERIRVPVYEGLGSNVMQNTRIGVIDYELPFDLPKNHPVHIKLWLDRQAIATVTVEVDGFDFKKEQSLTRELTEQPATEEFEEEEPLFDDDEEEEDEQQKQLAILEVYLERGRQFAVDYGKVLTPAQKRRLNQAIAGAEETLNNEAAEKAMNATMNLDRLMLRCGTASLIDQAHLAADSADQETATQLHHAADEVKRLAEGGEAGQVARASAPLASLIRQVHKRAKGIDKIDAATTYGGLLRDGREAKS